MSLQKAETAPPLLHESMTHKSLGITDATYRGSIPALAGHFFHRQLSRSYDQCPSHYHSPPKLHLPDNVYI